MATNFTQQGHVIQWKNETGGTLASGALAWIGGLPGVLIQALVDDATGSVALSGVWALAKHNHSTPASGTAFAVGDPVFWDIANSRACATAVFPLVGHCTEAATGDDTTVNVLLAGKRVLLPVIAAETIDDGELVYISGYDAKGYLKVSLADADASAPANAAIAVAIADIANTAIGHVGDAYLLTGQNTDSASAIGDAVFLSDTPGGWTLTAPTTAGDTQQQVGVVTVKNATTGAVLLCPGLFKATTDVA